MDETSEVESQEVALQAHGATPAASADVLSEAPTEEEVDWEHIHLSPQSIWPITFAAGIALFGAGTVTMWPVSFAGLVVMIIALVYWIQELLHEPDQSH